jgi:hypothetical protein
LEQEQLRLAAIGRPLADEADMSIIPINRKGGRAFKAAIVGG